MADIMHIGISGLMAYQTALNVASQNITNADTPFYSRRSVDFKENPFNSGVNVSDVRRIYDETANRYVQTTNSDMAKWSLYSQQISNFEPLLDNPATSIDTFLNSSLDALNAIQSNFNPSNRSLYMSSLQAVSTQFQHVNAEIDRQMTNVNLSLQTEVQQINNILSALNGINDQMLTSLNSDHPELLDQRESLVQELSTYFDFTTLVDQNGLLDLSLSNGLSLLKSNPPLTFTTIQDAAKPNTLLIAAKSNTTVMDITPLIHGGEIAGWLDYRNDALESARTDLDRLAMVFADNLNHQNQLGVDANGNLGGRIFADINSSGVASSRVSANAYNTGSTSSMNVTIDDTSAILNTDYRMNIGASNSYTLTRLSDNTVVSTGSLSSLPATISADGFTINVPSGTFNAGDRYTISPTHGGANNLTLDITDPSQLALGWPVTAHEGVKQPGSNGHISVTAMTDTTTSAFATPKQLDPPIEIRFSSPTSYTIYDATTNTAIEGPITYDPTTGADVFPTSGGYDPGYKVLITGNNIQAGDTFEIEYNTNSSGDNYNARAMAALYHSPTVLGANGQMVNFSQAYSLLSRDISVKTNNAQARYQTSQQANAQAVDRRDRVSGVSLQEETMNLAQYQAAYQASAQILETARAVFDMIIAISRG